MTKFKSSLTDYIFLIISGILFVMGGTGTYKEDAVILSIVNGILFIGIKLIQNVKIQIPKNFYLYLVFLLSFFIHNLFFNGRVDFFLLFVSGGIYWLLAYNVRSILSKHFPYFLLFFGILMGLLLIYSHINHVYFLDEINLFLPVSNTVRHNHIGDLWAIILVWIIYNLTHKIHNWHLLFILIGIWAIVISLSRSALVALSVGSAYIFYASSSQKIFKKYFIYICIVCMSLFIYFGMGKTTIFARPYFLEALEGLVSYPFGTGVGNFNIISSESIYTHNLVLEIVYGMGIYSIIFILWLFRVLLALFKNSGNTLYIALYLSLFTNFMFDTTYVIPTMIWIWFTLLALIDTNLEIAHKKSA